MGDMFAYGKLCPFFFFTLVRESYLKLPFWPRFFTGLNCVVLDGLGYLPFLIKAITLFLLIVRSFKCQS